MITKDLLLLMGFGMFSIINTNDYKFVRKIYVPNCSYFSGHCKFNKNNILTGDGEGLKQWRIEGDDLKLISEKKGEDIWKLLNLGKGHILSGSCSSKNGEIKIYYLKN